MIAGRAVFLLLEETVVIANAKRNIDEDMEQTSLSPNCGKKLRWSKVMVFDGKHVEQQAQEESI